MTQPKNIESSVKRDTAYRCATLTEKGGRIVDVSTPYAELLGYSSQELWGAPIERVIAPRDVERLVGYGRRRESGEAAPPVYEFHALHRAGSEIPVLARIKASRSDRETVIRTQVDELPHSLDIESFQHVYDLYSPMIYTLALRIRGTQAAAVESLQETFLEAWQHRLLFNRTRGSLAAWLTTICRRRCIDAVRRVERSTAKTSSKDRLALKVEQERLSGLLEEVPAQQRAMLELVYFEGLSLSSVVKRTGLPLGTVKAQIIAGVKNLRALMCG